MPHGNRAGVDLLPLHLAHDRLPDDILRLQQVNLRLGVLAEGKLRGRESPTAGLYGCVEEVQLVGD